MSGRWQVGVIALSLVKPARNVLARSPWVDPLWRNKMLMTIIFLGRYAK